MQTKYRELFIDAMIVAGCGGIGAVGGKLFHSLVNARRNHPGSKELSDNFTEEDLMDEVRPASLQFDKYNSDREHYIQRDG